MKKTKQYLTFLKITWKQMAIQKKKIICSGSHSKCGSFSWFSFSRFNFSSSNLGLAKKIIMTRFAVVFNDKPCYFILCKSPWCLQIKGIFGGCTVFMEFYTNYFYLHRTKAQRNYVFRCFYGQVRVLVKHQVSLSVHIHICQVSFFAQKCIATANLPRKPWKCCINWHILYQHI